VVCVALKLGGRPIPMSEQREQLMRLADTGKVLVRLARCENCARITEVFDIWRDPIWRDPAVEHSARQDP